MFKKQNKKQINKSGGKRHLSKKKHSFLKPLIIVGSAVCAAGLCVGVVFAVKNNSPQKVKVTFDAGLGTFSDGSRVKTITVNKGTNLNQIPHEYASIAYGATNHWYLDEEFEIFRYIIVPKTCTVKTWVTNDNKTINENNGYADYTINNDVTLFTDYSNDLLTAKTIATSEIANATNMAVGHSYSYEKIQAMAEVAYGWLDCASDGYQALAIGEASAGAIKWLSFQPESYDKISSALNLAYSQILATPTDGRALGIGISASKAAEGIARQTEAEGLIAAIMQIIYDNIHDFPSAAAGYALGYTSGYAALAISYQPEAATNITNTYLSAIDHLEAADDVYETFAICNTATKAVIADCCNDESHDLITYLASTAYAFFHNSLNDSRVEAISETSAEAVIASAYNPSPERNGSYYTKATQKIYSVMPKITTLQQARALGHVGAGAIEGIAYENVPEEMVLAELGLSINRILNINE